LSDILTEIFQITPDFDHNDPMLVRMAAHWPEFVAWLEKAREHHEFPDLLSQVESLTKGWSSGERLSFARHLLRSAWHAARWHGESTRFPDERPDPYFEERVSLEQLQIESTSVARMLRMFGQAVRRGGEFTKKFAAVIPAEELERWGALIEEARERIVDLIPASIAQVGPLFYPSGLDGRTRTPNAATLLAVDAVVLFRAKDVTMDWNLTATLARIACVDDQIDSSSLRVSAMRIWKQIEQKEVMFVGWPLDIGGTMADVASTLRSSGEAEH